MNRSAQENDILDHASQQLHFLERFNSLLSKGKPLSDREKQRALWCMENMSSNKAREHACLIIDNYSSRNPHDGDFIHNLLGG
jgi:hypothetical protein